MTKDLNLLCIFQALIETGSVTEAAKRLRMSQPNLSRALKILRNEFGDPLFVRTSRGIVPTNRAIELSQPVLEALNTLEKVYLSPAFDIAKAKGRFTIATTDYIEMFLGPKLACTVNREAPGITLNFRPSHGALPKSEIERGDCDLCVLVMREPIPSSYYKQDLFNDPYVCAVRKQHPILRSKKQLNDFLEYGHAMINPQGTLWSITDERLQKIGKQRRLVLGSPNSISCAVTVSRSDLILTATERFLKAAMEFLPLVLFEGPFEIEPIHIAQIWHERSHQDELHRWFRNKVKEIL